MDARTAYVLTFGLDPKLVVVTTVIALSVPSGTPLIRAAVAPFELVEHDFGETGDIAACGLSGAGVFRGWARGGQWGMLTVSPCRQRSSGAGSWPFTTVAYR